MRGGPVFQTHRQDKQRTLGPSAAHPQRVVRLWPRSCPRAQRKPVRWGRGSVGLRAGEPGATASRPADPAHSPVFAEAVPRGSARHSGAPGAYRYRGARSQPPGADPHAESCYPGSLSQRAGPSLLPHVGHRRAPAPPSCCGPEGHGVGVGIKLSSLPPLAARWQGRGFPVLAGALRGPRAPLRLRGIARPGTWAGQPESCGLHTEPCGSHTVSRVAPTPMSRVAHTPVSFKCCTLCVPSYWGLRSSRRGEPCGRGLGQMLVADCKCLDNTFSLCAPGSVLGRPVRE